MFTLDVGSGDVRKHVLDLAGDGSDPFVVDKWKLQKVLHM